jgi:hypothetical protein
MKNTYTMVGDEVLIAVRYRGEPMICHVDAADLEWLMTRQVTWHVNRAREGKWYVQCKMGGRTVLMHRFVMRAPKGSEVHHRDNDGLNNRRENLEFLTHQSNIREQWPGRDWREYDAKKRLMQEYRTERAIAAAVEREFHVCRQAVWKVRVGETLDGELADAYWNRCKAAGVRTLEALKMAHPRPGKWGVSVKQPRGRAHSVIA